MTKTTLRGAFLAGAGLIALSISGTAWADGTPECNNGSTPNSTECGTSSFSSNHSTHENGTAVGVSAGVLADNGTVVGAGAQAYKVPGVSRANAPDDLRNEILNDWPGVTAIGAGAAATGEGTLAPGDGSMAGGRSLISGINFYTPYSP